MNDDRYQHGLETMMQYQADDGAAPGHVALQESLAEIAPDVARYVVEFAFGDIYARPGLTKHEQAIATIASLTALGTEPQIRLHVNTGLNVGLSFQKVVATIVHLLPYIGFPRVLNALEVAKSVARERGIDLASAQGGDADATPQS
jgi:4-carboxymuconolactone decarboxylase